MKQEKKERLHRPWRY